MKEIQNNGGLEKLKGKITRLFHETIGGQNRR